MPSDRVAVLVRRLGPYHVARLKALAQALGSCSVFAVEVCTRDDVYAWDPVQCDAAFERRTLFSDVESARRVGPLWSRLEQVLDHVAPTAAFLPGWSDPAALGMLRYCRARGIAGIMMSDSTEGDRQRSWWREEIKRRVVSQADAMLVAGSRHLAYAARLGMPRDRIATGYDVVDNAFFWAGAERARLDAAGVRRALSLPEKYFLASGRFVEKKNLLRLLNAYAMYRRREQREHLSLVLLGDGPLREQCAEFLRVSGLESHVVLPGFCQYEELPQYYGLAAALIHASTIDQWGLVVNEAAAAGLPLLVSRTCGCAPELVRDGENGWTFDPFDVEQIASKMSSLAGLPEARRRQMGAKSLELVRDWAPDRFVQGVMETLSITRAHKRRSYSYFDLALLRALAERHGSGSN